MSFKYRMNIEGEGRSDIAAILHSHFDIESSETSDEAVYFAAWSRTVRLPELIELSTEHPESTLTVDLMHDTTQLRCSIKSGEVTWHWEVDFTLDMDPRTSPLCGVTEEGHPSIPAIVPEPQLIENTLKAWGVTAHEVVVRDYSEDEIAELGLVRNSQIISLVQSA